MGKILMGSRLESGTLRESDPGNRSAMPTTDIQLLQEISNKQDRGAFAELQNRYAKKAYRLARFLTHNEEDALEAVQEAMLAVWRSAHSVKGDNAKGWIMRIVANKSLVILNKKKRTASNVSLDDVRDNLSAPDAIPEDGTDAEKNELMCALRQRLQTLPERERSILALYFGAGLTQDEVAQKLSIPQRTVSYLLKGIVDRLRDQMGKAGFAAGAAITATDFEAALCSFGNHSATEWTRLAESLETLTTSQELLSSASAPIKASNGWVLAVALIGVSIAAVVVSSTGLFEKPDSTMAQKSNNTPTPVEPLEVDTSVQSPSLPMRWLFDSPTPPEDIKILGLEPWGWNFKTKRLENHAPSAMVLPLKYSEAPIRIEIKMENMKAGQNFNCGLRYILNERKLLYTQWAKTIEFDAGQTYRCQTNVYILKNETVFTLIFKGRPMEYFSYALHDPDSNRAQFMFTFKNISLSELSVYESTVEEFQAQRVAVKRMIKAESIKGLIVPKSRLYPEK